MELEDTLNALYAAEGRRNPMTVGAVLASKEKKVAGTFPEIYAEAEKAAKEAYDTARPTPVIFGQAVGLFGADANRMVPGTERLELEGVCGFAWVEVRPTRSPFAKWLRDNDKGRYDSYKRCVTVWVGGASQSMERKEAYAEAFARVLRSHGISASDCSRLD